MANLTEAQIDEAVRFVQESHDTGIEFDTAFHELVAEVRRHRAAMKRIEEAALSMEHSLDPGIRALGDGLRKRVGGV